MSVPLVREPIARPVRRVLRWMLSLRDASGAIVCPQHKIEHTGKSAGAIVMACALARHDPEADRDELLSVAVQQARRLVSRLEREGESTCFTFRPGRHDPYNCSNNVIDGGACSDALAELVLAFGDRLSAEERESFQHASVLHAQTYLRYAILDKAIPAQRAWAMTGVAGAWKLADHDVLELAVTEGVGILEGLQHADGSFPYHPLEGGPGHVGASDVSAFYQSRVTAFLMFALERIGRNPASELFRGPIRRGLDFLLGLQGPDGIKCGLVEAKPWYWGANHEVVSHPFDTYALARGWHHFGHTSLARGARRAFEAWAERLAESGAPRSHLPGDGRRASYQCPVFWAGHTSWMARALADLEALWDGAAPDPGGPGAGIEIGIQSYPNASLSRLDDGVVTAWVRGVRPGFNLHHGSPHGAGLVRVVRNVDGSELLTRRGLDARAEGEWSGASGRMQPGRGVRSGKKELRFSLWLARNQLRGGHAGAALLTPVRTFREGIIRFAAPRVSSAFHLAPRTQILSDGVRLASALARTDGTPVPGTELARTFRIDGDGLEVEDELLAAPGVRGLDYRVPEAATDVERESARVRYRLA
ncbi:MAG: hypothetical protein GY711_08055 [bacterium]|nr:hypothetical protein [bacterium]